MNNRGIVYWEPLQGLQILSAPKLALSMVWKLADFREQRFKSLSDKYTLYPFQGVIVDNQRNFIIELPIKDFEKVHLIPKS